MTNEERKSLRREAMTDLSGAELYRVLAMIEGPCRDKPATVRAVLDSYKEALSDDDREELRQAARANLSGDELANVLRLIDGEYRNDFHAVRGAIWSYVEGHTDDRC